jgi:DNA-binding CsgD family transcriptional regulator
VRFGLTDQQRRVIEGLAGGDDVDQIAVRLGVTAGRVHQVTAAAREQLGARTTLQAVATAAAIGLITVDHGQGAKLRRAREHLVAAARLMGDDS